MGRDRMSRHVRTLIGFIQTCDHPHREESKFIGVFDDPKAETRAVANFENENRMSRTRIETYATMVNGEE